MKQINIIFNCSPGFGILDNWIPILVSLRSKLPNANFIFAIPNRKYTDQFNENFFIHQLTEKIFNRVIVRSDSGLWFSVPSFKKAINLSGKIKSWFIITILERIKLFFFAKIFLKIQKKIEDKFYSKLRFSFNNIINVKTILLFDLHELNKPISSYINTHLSKVKKYSLLHGIDVRGVREMQKNRQKKSTKNVTAYLHSKLEIDFYKKEYDLKDDNLNVIGITRHEKNWLNLIEKKSSSLDFEIQRKFIFIIGRPSNPRYLPEKRKLQALKDIKLVAEKFKFNIIIKLHPKENDKEVYQSVFKNLSNNLKFSFSNQHPLIIGKYCDFAVTFFSGVAVDMIKLGIPVIERLDLRDLPFTDNPESLRNDKGDPIFSYRALKLVLGASNSDEFQNAVNKILNNRSKVIKELKAAYDRAFPTINDINNKITEEIIFDIEKNIIHH